MATKKIKFIGDVSRHTRFVSNMLEGKVTSQGGGAGEPSKTCLKDIQSGWTECGSYL